MNRRAGISRYTLSTVAAVGLAYCFCGSAGAEPGSAGDREVLDRILLGVQDPAMRQRWVDAYQSGTLPALSRIPLPNRSVTNHHPKPLRVAEVPPRRPILSDATVIDVQPFSETARTRYEGAFQVRSHRAESIQGTIGEQQEPFELVYRLPGRSRQAQIEDNETYHLVFNDEAVDMTRQRRILVLDRSQRRLLLGIIAEGSNDPFQAMLEKPELTITQSANGPRPTVNVTVNGQTVTLRQGDQASLGNGRDAINVYLLGSYHHIAVPDSLREGQAYHVRILFYR